MPNPYYAVSGSPSTGAAGSSSTMRAELVAVQAGFALLPTLAGNSLKIIGVNTGETALTAVSTTGTGSVVLDTSPTLVTPALGVATATSINKVAITAPAASATLTIANGKTLTASNTLTLAGTDATVMTFPTTSATIARTDTGQTFTGANTFGALTLGGTVSGGGQNLNNIIIGAVTPLAVTGTTITATTKFLAADGAAATPSIAFSSQTGTGFHYLASNWIIADSGGTASVGINSATTVGLQVLQTLPIGFGSLGGVNNTGISQLSVGVLCIGTGAAGSFAGDLKLTNLTAVGTLGVTGLLTGSTFAYSASASPIGTFTSTNANGGYFVIQGTGSNSTPMAYFGRGAAIGVGGASDLTITTVAAMTLATNGGQPAITATSSATPQIAIPGHRAGTATWVAGDKYLTVDASGNIHVSAIGPAS